jgi:two-component system, OmpR family, sensor histidine kinase CreC
MYLGIRMFFAVCAMLGLAAFFVFYNFRAEIRPSVHDVMEEVMIDSAYLMAELAAEPLQKNTLTTGDFAQQMANYRARKIDANIWGMSKETLDFRVLVIDTKGVVQFDSEKRDLGADYSAWRDVVLALRGEYGARTSRNNEYDAPASTFYTSAPIMRDGKIIGVLSLAKSTDTVDPFIERAERRVLRSGFWLLALSLVIGVFVTLWTVWEVRRIAHYADEVDAGKRVAKPRSRGELGKLASAIDSMRLRLEGQHYVERYVTALTHELKSPLAAVRASGELLRDELPVADRERFANHVVEQSERMRISVERLLELTRLEQTQRLERREIVLVSKLLADARSACATQAEFAAVTINIAPIANTASCRVDRELILLALTNLIDNAIAFSPKGGVVTLAANLESRHVILTITDQGAGIAPEMMDRIGERFVSTARPNGAAKSSGLGLSIVKQVVELHGGTFAITNVGNTENAVLGAAATVTLTT